jgi:putative ABC transport system substrate-binding protein
MFKPSILIGASLSLLLAIPLKFYFIKSSTLPVVAIANYGPHASLTAAISGFKAQMTTEGFVENKNIRYVQTDVGFDQSLVGQMLSALQAQKPEVILAMTTPVAQVAKRKIRDIPIVYTVITDPVAAGILKEKYQSDGNMTGSSDQQNLDQFLKFATTLLPRAKTIGLLYATGEANDSALLTMMQNSAKKQGLSVLAIPVEQARDVQTRMLAFKGKVDLIYVGTSGPIQPSLPVISAQARHMRIPVFNVEAQAVRDGLSVASFSVDYHAVGQNAGKLAAKILKGSKPSELTPLYPKNSDHHRVIHQRLAAELNLSLPTNAEIVRDL